MLFKDANVIDSRILFDLTSSTIKVNVDCALVLTGDGCYCFQATVNIMLNCCRAMFHLVQFVTICLRKERLFFYLIFLESMLMC